MNTHPRLPVAARALAALVVLVSPELARADDPPPAATTTAPTVTTTPTTTATPPPTVTVPTTPVTVTVPTTPVTVTVPSTKVAPAVTPPSRKVVPAPRTTPAPRPAPAPTAPRAPVTSGATPKPTTVPARPTAPKTKTSTVKKPAHKPKPTTAKRKSKSPAAAPTTSTIPSATPPVVGEVEVTGSSGSRHLVRPVLIALLALGVSLLALPGLPRRTVHSHADAVLEIRVIGAATIVIAVAAWALVVGH